jgi:hypothetical protein
MTIYKKVSKDIDFLLKIHKYDDVLRYADRIGVNVACREESNEYHAALNDNGLSRKRLQSLYDIWLKEIEMYGYEAETVLPQRGKLPSEQDAVHVFLCDMAIDMASWFLRRATRPNLFDFPSVDVPGIGKVSVAYQSVGGQEMRRHLLVDSSFVFPEETEKLEAIINYFVQTVCAGIYHENDRAESEMKVQNH